MFDWGFVSREEAGSSAPQTWNDQTGWTDSLPGEATVNNQGADWSAAGSQPAAKDWGDVMRFGFARLVDAKVRPLKSENTAPVLANGRPGVPGAAGVASLQGGSWLWLAGGVGLLLLLGAAVSKRAA